MPKAHERGVWISPANGNIIHIGRFRSDLYNQTAVSCIFDMSFPAHMGLVHLMVGASIEAKDDTLKLILQSSIDDASFRRAPTLPSACSTEPDTSPKGVFDTMWHAMDENYAFFDLHGVNWEARKELSPEPGAEMAEIELFELMQEALTGLDDGHVQLIAGDLGYFSPSLSPEWMPEPELERSDLNQMARDAIGIELTRSDLAPLEYGLTPDGFGYILITGMWAEDKLGVSPLRMSERAFTEVAEQMRDARGIIIDVRYNPGGNDGTAFAYAGHFSPDERAVFFKQTKMGTGWLDRTDAIVVPAPAARQLNQPVVLLTSRLTGSGAEIFTMAMRDLPQVITIGEATGGGLSDIHGITLPNGWLFGLSNQEYRTMSGELFEGVGVPVDIEVPISSDALLDGNDEVLETAISTLKTILN